MKASAAASKKQAEAFTLKEIPKPRKIKEYLDQYVIGQDDAKAVRVDALDGKVSWQHIENAQGCNVRYGIAPDKLYQSWLVYDADEVTLSTLMAGQDYYVCVDSFNENGITTGEIIKMEG